MPKWVYLFVYVYLTYMSIHHECIPGAIEGRSEEVIESPGTGVKDGFKSLGDC